MQLSQLQLPHRIILIICLRSANKLAGGTCLVALLRLLLLLLLYLLHMHVAYAAHKKQRSPVNSWKAKALWRLISHQPSRHASCEFVKLSSWRWASLLDNPPLPLPLFLHTLLGPPKARQCQNKWLQKSAGNYQAARVQNANWSREKCVKSAKQMKLNNATKELREAEWQASCSCCHSCCCSCHGCCCRCRPRDGAVEATLIKKLFDKKSARRLSDCC